MVFWNNFKALKYVFNNAVFNTNKIFSLLIYSADHTKGIIFFQIMSQSLISISQSDFTLLRFPLIKKLSFNLWWRLLNCLWIYLSFIIGMIEAISWYTLRETVSMLTCWHSMLKRKWFEVLFRVCSFGVKPTDE